MTAGLDTCHIQLGVTDEVFEAVRLVATRDDGRRGTFGYEAFAWVNATLFDGRLPTPLLRGS